MLAYGNEFGNILEASDYDKYAMFLRVRILIGDKLINILFKKIVCNNYGVDGQNKELKRNKSANAKSRMSRVPYL